ncbi:carboxyltransferase domain-containing protein [Cellulomonas sp. ACRRI]|uniref:carboxyltransferase domain-containing protein n=1 Tax=Cellulomonas sp. ACRRI TaxID=2918188 RepID=UPI0027E0F0F2|nr:carboxyltransferase domain-containing protein [Cellulomonas sp. ACRRI]
MTAPTAEGVRVVPYGVDALLADLPDLAAVRALDDALRVDPPPGAVDVVPAARTVLVRFATPGEARAAVDAMVESAGVAVAAARTRTRPALPARTRTRPALPARTRTPPALPARTRTPPTPSSCPCATTAPTSRRSPGRRV